MDGLSRLKTFLLFAFILAMVSFLVMFYYSVNFSNYTKILGTKHEGTSRRGANLDRDLSIIEQTLFSDNSTSPSNFSDTGVSKQGHVQIDTQPSLRSNASSTEQNILREDIKVLKNTTNSSNNESTAVVIEQNRLTTGKPSLAPTNTINNIKGSDNITQELNLCTPSSLVGPLFVDQNVPKMADVEKKMSSEFSGWVNKGGSWKPTECKATVKMALIIPYRNRYEQLSVFVRHMHPMLKRQNLDYRIFVIEQAGDTIFNRALMFNIGFKEALKFDQYECFIFHDVDLIPENDRNEYSCPTSPRHLSVAVDKFNYRLPYHNIFGGAGSFSRQHFELINGLSNNFWGWGGEDDDLFNRIHAKQLKLTRPSMQLGRYKMLKIFHHTGKEDPERFAKLRDSAQRMNTDGINSLKYHVNNVTEHWLYTLVTVDVKEALDSYRNS